MPKFFACSDIHSAYTPWMKALKEAGFDANDPDHIIVVCGDLFDRMDESLQVYDFVIDMIERGKLIYIRGNHMDLLEKCIDRGYPCRHDWKNGTAKTIIDLAPSAENFYDACQVVREKIKPLLDRAVNYFETKNKYIFVHGWISLTCKDNLPIYYTRNRWFEYNPDWRNAHYSEWEQARWVNGMDMARKGFIESGRTIICGHWHCSYGHMVEDMAKNGPFDCIDEFGPTAIWEPYYGDGIVAIDKCVAHTGELHCLVLEDDFMENNNE